MCKRIDTRPEHEQERHDSLIMRRLLDSKDIYPDAPNDRYIEIKGIKYSIHWILCYAQARNAGVTCMYSSGEHANERLYSHRNPDFGREYHRCYNEPGNPFSRKRDTLLLAKANEYLREHGLYQKPQG